MNDRPSAPGTSATGQSSAPLLERVTDVHGASNFALHILEAIRDDELARGAVAPALNRLSASGLITVRQGRCAKVSARPAAELLLCNRSTEESNEETPA